MAKNSKWWALIGTAVAIGLALAGCGSGSSSSDASLRVANATLTHPSLDLLASTSTIATGTTSDTVSAYGSIPAGATISLQVSDTGSSTPLAANLRAPAAGNHYTLLAYESSGAVKTALLSEDYPLPAANTALLRIYDAAPEAGNLDVYITDPTTDLNSASPVVSLISTNTPIYGPLTYGPGTYRVRVTGAGNKADLRLDMPAVTLASQQLGMIALTPATGGSLLNGSLLLQQSTYTAVRNTNVRVRLAAAVAGGATVAASGGGATIESGAVAPSYGFYSLVPANTLLNITVNGNSVGAPPAASLAAGSDVTLFVYGPAASATASLLVDDNRAPSDTSQVKLRLINGVTNSAGNLTLTANSSLIASNVAPGTASNYTSVPISATVAPVLTVLSSAVQGNLLVNSNPGLNQGQAKAVLIGGDVSAPTMLIR